MNNNEHTIDPAVDAGFIKVWQDAPVWANYLTVDARGLRWISGDTQPKVDYQNDIYMYEGRQAEQVREQDIHNLLQSEMLAPLVEQARTFGSKPHKVYSMCTRYLELPED